MCIELIDTFFLFKKTTEKNPNPKKIEKSLRKKGIDAKVEVIRDSIEVKVHGIEEDKAKEILTGPFSEYIQRILNN